MQKKLCKAEGCTTPAHARGYCGRHWHRFMRYGDPLGGGSERIPNRRCVVSGCGETHVAKGYCKRHYRQLQVYGEVESVASSYHTPQAQPPTCTVDGCKDPAIARGYCRLHWRRWKRQGEPGDFDGSLLRDRQAVVGCSGRGKFQPTCACGSPSLVGGLCGVCYKDLWGSGLFKTKGMLMYTRRSIRMLEGAVEYRSIV
jgi:hypothetical protein